MWSVKTPLPSLHPSFGLTNMSNAQWFGVFTTVQQKPIGVYVQVKKGRLFVSSINGHEGPLKVGDKLIQINDNIVKINNKASEEEEQNLYATVKFWLSQSNSAKLMVKRDRLGERRQRIEKRERNDQKLSHVNTDMLFSMDLFSDIDLNN